MKKITPRNRSWKGRFDVIVFVRVETFILTFFYVFPP